MIPSLKVSNCFKNSQSVWNVSHIKNVNISGTPQNNQVLIYNNNSFNYDDITNLSELQALETPPNANTLKVNDTLLLEDNNGNNLSIGIENGESVISNK